MSSLQKMTMAESIRLTAKFIHEGREMVGKANFTLGIGPCGKEVVAMSIIIEKKWITITQICSDDEVKTFLYHTSQLCGRVEVTHA